MRAGPRDPQCERRLSHHQRVVRDDQLRGAGTADRVLHETTAVMGASAMDALAAPVRERGDERGTV